VPCRTYDFPSLHGRAIARSRKTAEKVCDKGWVICGLVLLVEENLSHRLTHSKAMLTAFCFF